MTQPSNSNEVSHSTDTLRSLSRALENEATSDIEMPSTTLGLWLRVRSSLALPVIIVIVIFTLIGETQNSYFLSEATWVNILTSASFTSIVACFEGLVLISGGLDLSVGAVFLAGAMSAAELVQMGQSDIVAS